MVKFSIFGGTRDGLLKTMKNKNIRGFSVFGAVEVKKDDKNLIWLKKTICGTTRTLQWAIEHKTYTKKTSTQ